MNGSRKHVQCGAQPEERARTVSARELQARCLEIIDEVNTRQLDLVITEGGVPIARLTPAGGVRLTPIRAQTIVVPDDRRIAAARASSKQSVDDLLSP